MLLNSIFFFLNIFFLLGGSSGIILALLVYIRNRNRLIILYAFTLLAWSLNQLLLAVYYYLNEILLIHSQFFNSLLNDIGFVALSIFLYLASSLVYSGFDRKFSSLFRSLLMITCIFMLLPSSYSAYRFDAYESLFLTLEAVKALCFYAVLYYLAFYIRGNTKNVADEEVRKILKAIFYIQMIFFPVMILEGSLFDYRLYPFGVSSFSLFYFLLNMIWLYFISRYLFLPELKMVDLSDSLENYYAACRISRREREVVALLLEGLSYEEIAERLFIALETVKTHVNNIYKKSGVKSKIELSNLIKKFEK